MPGCRPFFKYSSPDTALAVLRSRAVRYNSPLKFNDSFDIQSGLHLDFEIESLHDKVLDRIRMLAESPEEPPVDSSDVWGQIVLTARRYFTEHGFPMEKWKDLTRRPFRELLKVIEQTRSDYQLQWQQNLLPSIRVFCVSEERDNLLMWAHYARDHTGAVFEFWSLPDEDNALSIARPVIYVKQPPPFFTEEEWLNDLVGIRKLDSENLFRRYAYTKSNHWEYEREWRVWYPYSDPAELFDTVPIRESELKALYLGCRIDKEQKAEMLRLLRAHFPKAKAFQAVKTDAVYALTFTEI